MTEYVQVITSTGIEFRPIIRKEISLDKWLDGLIGNYIEELNIPFFLKNGIKYIARIDIITHPDVKIASSTASERDDILRKNGLYSHPRETISRKEYGLREKSSAGTNFTSYGRPLILLSVDDAIIFISYGQSDIKKVETIKKLVCELRKYRNISKLERILRQKDCWRHMLNLDAISYEWLITTKQREKIPLMSQDRNERTAYKLLMESELWRRTKLELYRYLALKCIDLPYFKDSRFHHEPPYDFKHLCTKGQIIHKNKHKKGSIWIYKGKLKFFTPEKKKKKKRNKLKIGFKS